MADTAHAYVHGPAPGADAGAARRDFLTLTAGALEGPFGGWFCPCHGSVYGTSAGIRQGPAPRNLDVPAYQFTSPTAIKIG